MEIFDKSKFYNITYLKEFIYKNKQQTLAGIGYDGKQIIISVYDDNIMLKHYLSDSRKHILNFYVDGSVESYTEGN